MPGHADTRGASGSQRLVLARFLAGAALATLALGLTVLPWNGPQVAQDSWDLRELVEAVDYAESDGSQVAAGLRHYLQWGVWVVSGLVVAATAAALLLRRARAIAVTLAALAAVNQAFWLLKVRESFPGGLGIGSLAVLGSLLALSASAVLPSPPRPPNTRRLRSRHRSGVIKS